ncbi:MAG: hypothetical protein R3E95_02780 [Thiolinea sp.]
MLLAAYLKQYAEGDIRRRDTLPPLLSEDVSADNWQGQRIMLARQTLQDSPKLTLLYLVSVFDQPVQRELLAELMRAIGKGLSDRFPQVSIGSIAGWQKVAAMCAGFTAAGIVAGQSSGIPGHAPAGTGIFPQRVCVAGRCVQDAGASGVVCVLPGCTGKELPDSLEEMRPLFSAVAHGCAAGLHQQVWDEVFWKRIQREDYYLWQNLGAFSDNLAILAHFLISMAKTILRQSDDRQARVI